MLLELLLFAGVFLIVSALGLGLLLLADRGRHAHQERLRRYRVRRDATPPTRFRRSRRRAAPRRGATPRDPAAWLCRQAGVPRDALGGLTGLLALGTAAGTAALVLGLGRPWPAALPLSAAASGVLTTILLTTRKRARLRTLVAALPDALETIVRGLRAGQPVAVALGTAARSTQGPLQAELLRCQEEMSLGSSLAEALHALSRRVLVAEIRFFAVATSLQTETGGNLVETLETLIRQLRARARLDKKIKAFSSEARASALILSILPFGVGGALLAMNPDYARPLLTDPRGTTMLGYGGGSLLVGLVVMARMVRLDD